MTKQLTMLFIPGQKAIITNKAGQVLILKRNLGVTKAGLWDLPGGKVEFGEIDLDKALLRELEEELGLKPQDIRVGAIIEIVSILLDNSKQLIRTYKKCELKANPQIQLSPEHTEFKWIKPQEAEDYKFRSKDLKEIIQKS